MLIFNDALVALNLEAADSQAVIDLLAGLLHSQGLVSEEYGRLTYERELEHPTGLPTRPFAIAFPHADASGVNQSGLALATLAKAVPFRNMGDPDEELPVQLVLMLANREPAEQIQTLRNLAVLFGKPDQLQTLRDQPTPQAAVAWLRRELRLDEAA